MKRLCLVMIAALALSGCRSSQQPTNPFLRTTVPPPGTGEGAVVVPGDPYYPGAPMAQPVAPAPVAPVQLSPQQVVPQTPDLKRAVPGGDYMYHQSSVDERGDVERLTDGRWEAAQSAAAESAAVAVNAAAPDALRLGGPSDAVAQALALAEEPVPVQMAHFTDNGGTLPGETPIRSKAAHVSATSDSSTESLDDPQEEPYELDTQGRDIEETERSTPQLDASSDADLAVRIAVA